MQIARLADRSEVALLEASIVTHDNLIGEGYGRVLQYDYNNWHRDPRPLVLILGYWTHPSTGNNLLCGLNLNELTAEQVTELRKVLPRILRSSKSPKIRYRVGKHLLPDVFVQADAYRTYNIDHVIGIEPYTLRFYNPKADRGRETTRLLKIQKALKKEKLRKAKLQKVKPDMTQYLTTKKGKDRYGEVYESRQGDDLTIVVHVPTNTIVEEIGMSIEQVCINEGFETRDVIGLSTIGQYLLYENKPGAALVASHLAPRYGLTPRRLSR